MRLFQRPHLTALAALGLAGVALTTASLATGRQGQVREFTVTGRDHRFSPSRLEVQKDDLIKITFTAGDIAHSFTVDSYRIAKRAGAGQSVVFEFRADQTGTFTFYCNLTVDERCRQMKGELIVR